MNWLSLASGLVKLFNLITGWLRDNQLKEEGAELERGKQNAETLEGIQKVKDFESEHSDPASRDKLRNEIERE